MAPSSPVFRFAPAAASAAVLAISVGLFPGVPAAADSPEPTPATTTSAAQVPADCQLLCLPVLAEELLPTEPGDRPRKAKEPGAPPPQPAAPAPAPAPPDQPAVPAVSSAATVPAPVAPSVAPVPEDSDSGAAVPEATVPAPGATASSGPTPSSGPTGASNWNTPVTRSAQATHVAAVSPADGRGTDDAAVLPVIAGVLLVGVSGVAFAWWGRNRLRAH